MADPEAVFLMRVAHIESGPDIKRGLAMPEATMMIYPKFRRRGGVLNRSPRPSFCE
jgi:hypothetical protein